MLVQNDKFFCILNFILALLFVILWILLNTSLLGMIPNAVLGSFLLCKMFYNNRRLQNENRHA